MHIHTGYKHVYKTRYIEKKAIIILEIAIYNHNSYLHLPVNNTLMTFKIVNSSCCTVLIGITIWYNNEIYM